MLSRRSLLQALAAVVPLSWLPFPDKRQYVAAYETPVDIELVAGVKCWQPCEQFRVTVADDCAIGDLLICDGPDGKARGIDAHSLGVPMTNAALLVAMESGNRGDLVLALILDRVITVGSSS